MSTRAEKCLAFLAQSGWSNAQRSLLAGDASMRRYDRLAHPLLGKAVLMDAPPEKGEDIRPFIKIAAHLKSIGLSPPNLIAKNQEEGFLLLEDLGDTLFARVLKDTPAQENLLYATAIDALIVAQGAPPPPGLLDYGPGEMAETAQLALDWYLAYSTPAPEAARQEFEGLITKLLQTYLTGSAVLTQRDYHAENLIWLENRTGVERVGLLDFQDAMLAHPAYDLASILKDARRDVRPDVQQSSFQRYLDHTGYSEEAFADAYAICSAQRNLRILGVFARLSIRDGKTHYPDLMPRVWRNLKEELQHPSLNLLRNWVEQYMPAPTPELIAEIKAANV